MADGYWGHQPPLHSDSYASKRQRSDYDIPAGASVPEKPNYFPSDGDRIGHHASRDTASIGASYDRYLQTSQKVPFGSEDADYASRFGKGVGGRLPDFAEGMQNSSFRDPVKIGAPGRSFGERQGIDRGYQLPTGSAHLPLLPGREMQLPPGASDAIFVDSLPHDCTEREIAHIFRPFLGYKETRLVKKETKFRDGESKVICFVDFTSAVSAATAMSALQGYMIDERDPNSPALKLQFSRHPAPKSGHGPRSRSKK